MRLGDYLNKKEEFIKSLIHLRFGHNFYKNVDYTKQYAYLVTVSSFGWKTGTCSINVVLNIFQFTINNKNKNRINYLEYSVGNFNNKRK